MSAVVTVARHLGAPAERVFDAWVGPAAASKWLLSAPGGRSVRAEVGARPVATSRVTVDIQTDGDGREATAPHETAMMSGGLAAALA